jgi:hypothetical protein
VADLICSNNFLRQWRSEPTLLCWCLQVIQLRQGGMPRIGTLKYLHNPWTTHMSAHAALCFWKEGHPFTSGK